MARRRLLPRLVSILVFVSLFAVFTPAAVRADIAPPQPPLGSSIFPGQETTRVRMRAETVLIDLPSSSKFENWQAAVTATFSMRNLGDSAESLTVRFPMFMTVDYRGVEEGCPQQPDMNYPWDSNYPAIQNFRVLAAGIPLSVTIIDAALVHIENGATTTVRKPCWAEFPITFPAGKDLKVEVRYQIQGQLYGHGTSNYLGFPYILTTGAGWQGTIGSADVRLHLPYPISDLNIMDISQGGKISGSDVRWHFDDFEPQQNTGAWIVNPAIWQALQKDLSTTQSTPQDGEAWGRLGKSFKNILLPERGMREGASGEDLFRRSQEAYQKSVDLLPRDADWHYGFGDLLCQTSNWRPYYADSKIPSVQDLLTACMTQLQLALQINPTHARTLELLQWMGSFDGVVDLSGPKPDFLILTPGNYKTPTPWATMTDTPAPSPTSTVTSLPSATATPTPLPSLTQAPSPTQPEAISTAPSPTQTSTSQPKSGLPICGAIFLPLLLGLFIRRRLEH